MAAISMVYFLENQCHRKGKPVNMWEEGVFVQQLRMSLQTWQLQVLWPARAWRGPADVCAERFLSIYCSHSFIMSGRWLQMAQYLGSWIDFKKLKYYVRMYANAFYYECIYLLMGQSFAAMGRNSVKLGCNQVYAGLLLLLWCVFTTTPTHPFSFSFRNLALCHVSRKGSVNVN